MIGQQRMSPLTAIVFGIFGTGAVAIASVTTIVIYTMSIVDRNASTLIDLAENGVESLPEFIERLPALADAIGGQRRFDYADKLDVKVRFVPTSREGRMRPVMTITNRGHEVVSTLAIRVAAVSGSNVPLHEWTEVVATPIAVVDEWRGPIMPGATRHVVLSSRSFHQIAPQDVTAVTEFSEIRIWAPTSDPA